MPGLGESPSDEAAEDALTSDDENPAAHEHARRRSRGIVAATSGRHGERSSPELAGAASQRHGDLKVAATTLLPPVDHGTPRINE